MRRAACGRAPPHAVAAAGAAAGAASVVVAAGVSTTEVGVSEALAKRPMRRDEPMRFVAMTASTAPLRWRRSTYFAHLLGRALLRPLLADGAARARAAGVAHDLRGDGLMSRRRITWRQSTRASETASASVWQPSFHCFKNSLDVRFALGSLGYIDAVLKLRKRYRLYPSWLDDWPIFDARLSGGHLWVKRVLLRPLGRDPSSRAEDE